ncbi:MAG: GTPase Era [Solirubrobacterales bacterium]|nr:GTPase Era [Solirubrobacterales bacterium]
MTRAGFIALAGRPNVGKSTLVNAIVGQKVAIVSDKPQTTRRAARGVATGPDWQLILVDLPGSQRPRDALTTRMQARVERELGEADGALLVLNGEQGVGAGDRFLAGLLRDAPVPLVVAVNKVDRLVRGGGDRVLLALEATEQLGLEHAEVFPISARTGRGVGPLVEHLAGLLPESPFLYEPGDVTDQPIEVELAELVREQVLRRTFQEVPHSVEVVVEGIDEVRDGLLAVRALVWVETESQKGILIGAHGRMVKAVGTAARRELEKVLGTRVHLDLAVRVRRGWRADESLLDRLGIE